jgi:serine O-acetyltransferase
LTPAKQLQFYPNRSEFEAFLDLQLGLVGLNASVVREATQATYSKIAAIFSRLRGKYFNDSYGPVLRVAHNAQYTIFLYELSRTVFKKGGREQADRIYALLRMVSSVDLYYEVELPDLWGCDHPLGSVIGRGRFAPQSTLFFSQNCNIGNSRGVQPEIHGNLHMAANAAVLGRTSISGNVYLANGACVVDGGNLSDCLVFGRSPHLTIKPFSKERFAEMTAFRSDG